jgi:hypothetical protein
VGWTKNSTSYSLRLAWAYEIFDGRIGLFDEDSGALGVTDADMEPLSMLNRRFNAVRKQQKAPQRIAWLSCGPGESGG